MQERMDEGNEVFRLKGYRKGEFRKKGYRKGEFRKDGSATGEMMDMTDT